jgi:hypothetical protein
MATILNELLSYSKLVAQCKEELKLEKYLILKQIKANIDEVWFKANYSNQRQTAKLQIKNNIVIYGLPELTYSRGNSKTLFRKNENTAEIA